MSSIARLKQVLIGPSLPSSAHTEERLTRAAALAVLSSDALSSVAYATQEALIVLLIAGSSPAILGLSLPISVAIVLLLAIVVLSYRQTIRAYPKGGGSYIVARDNLGLFPGLIAGSSLLIDYVLTVTVSVSAGIDNLVSAFPILNPFSVGFCVVFIFLLMVANLRGVRESGKLFMVPTYAFIGGMFLLILVGMFHYFSGHAQAVPLPTEVPSATEPLSLFLVLKAFSAGCTALTGVEAISDGVMAFKPPEWKNARQTLIYLGLVLGTMFLGISYIAHLYQIVPDITERQTVISMLGRQIFGSGFFGGIAYYFVQITTLLVLLLAANTSFADFPRLCYFLSRDGFLPRQLSVLGDRLVYSNGIILLSLAAIALVILFKGSTSAIIPLYAVGVFTSFTLSQFGMVRHWFTLKEEGWRVSALFNGLGACVTSVVLTVIVWTKFTRGAWLVILAIPILIGVFLHIHRHYNHVAERLRIKNPAPRGYIPRPKADIVSHPAVVVVGGLHQGTMDALDYARSIADEIVAVHVDIGTSDLEKLQTRWRELESDIPLIILDSPYRSIASPLVNFVAEFEQQHPNTLSTVVLPVFITRTWWESLLHNQTTFFLKAALRAKRIRVITTVGYYL
jgi:amino acid transporter